MVMDIHLAQVLLQPRPRLTMVTAPRVGMTLLEVAAAMEEEEGMVMVETVEVGTVVEMEVGMEVVINGLCDPLSTRMQMILISLLL